MEGFEGELRGLARHPKEQMLLALEWLRDGGEPGAREAALEVLAGRAQVTEKALRPVLLGLYEKLDGPKKDPGGYLRTAIVQALRPAVREADVPLLERAAMTYDFSSYGGKDVAGMLRAEALVTLADVAPRVAGAHAVRMLFDVHTDEMSGEPALTAVRLLAENEQALPLYSYLLQEGQRLAEVVTECLKHMVHLPAALAEALVRRYLAVRSDVVHVAVVDLVVGHDEPAAVAPPLFEFLLAPGAHDVYRYAVTALVASRAPDLLKGVLRLAEREIDPVRRSSLRQALSLAQDSADVQRLLAQWDEG